LATVGGPSAARSAGTAKPMERKADTRRPRGAAEKGFFMGNEILQMDGAKQEQFCPLPPMGCGTEFFMPSSLSEWKLSLPVEESK
jgi:hypothetical protein